MPELMTTDVRQLLDRDPFDGNAVADLREALSRDPSRYRTLRDAASAILDREKGQFKPITHLRLGIAYVLLGRYASGLDHLNKAGDVGLAHFFRGLALENLQRHADAAEAFAAAAREKYEPIKSELHRAGALRRQGNLDAVADVLGSMEKTAGSSAEFHYQFGALHAARGELIPASAELEKSLALDKDHTGALFEMAYINDLYGNDDAAIDLYKRCTSKPPVPLAALINLGILFEDEMKFRDAEQCYRRVLDMDPNHPRARLFFKDCIASRGMFYDDEAESRYDQLRKLYEIPVTDFELSVRSRNCLRKMNIRTLGDLTRTTEIALLASKNFGETSLAEIKQIMESKGLRLGMALEAGERAAVGDFRMDPIEEMSQEEKALLAKPISDLSLSVRARKCMSKLGIQTVGELLSHTGDQLLECKNFGVTSLNEVREKLTQLGLKLKNE